MRQRLRTLRVVMSVVGSLIGVLGVVMLSPLALVLIFLLLLWILFRSFSAVVWPLVTILLSVAWGWGIPVWAGVTLTMMISLTIMLIFALAG